MCCLPLCVCVSLCAYVQHNYNDHVARSNSVTRVWRRAGPAVWRRLSGSVGSSRADKWPKRSVHHDMHLPWVQLDSVRAAGQKLVRSLRRLDSRGDARQRVAARGHAPTQWGRSYCRPTLRIIPVNRSIRWRSLVR